MPTVQTKSEYIARGLQLNAERGRNVDTFILSWILAEAWTLWMKDGMTVSNAINDATWLYGTDDDREILLQAFPAEYLDYGDYEKSFFPQDIAETHPDADDAETESAGEPGEDDDVLVPPLKPVSDFLAKNYYEKCFMENAPECVVCTENIQLENFALLQCGHYHCKGCTNRLAHCSMCRG